VTQPTIFIGEYLHGGTNDEVLTRYTNFTLQYGSAHHVRIQGYGVGTHWKYDVYVSGTLVDSTTYFHDTLNQAAFNGETNNNHVDMMGIADNNQSPFKTLQYLYNGVTWKYFGASAHYASSDPQYTSIRINGDATDVAYGDGKPC
jgi:hypothetical protein